MLGSSLSSTFPLADTLNGKKDLDLTNIQKTNEWFADKYYDVIIHCAAFTDLDYCDENPAQSRILHSEIIDHLSKYCSKLVYISTNPVDDTRVYYLTKHEGEKRTMLNNNANIVLRTNIYGKGGLADWAITQLRNNKKIPCYANVMFNAIHVEQLSNEIKNILSDPFANGVIDVAGNYSISKYDFICLLANYLNLDTNLIKKTTSVSKDLVIKCNSAISLSAGLKILKEDYE